MMSLLDGSGMTGDIWSTGAFAIESPLKDLLDSGNYSLEQLLAEDELLQELRGLHPQLLDYFSTEEAVASLVRYLIADPNKAVEETQQQQEEEKEPEQEEPQQQPQQQEQPQEAQEGEEKRAEPGKWLFQHLDDNKASNQKQNSAAADLMNPDNISIRFPYLACEIVCCELQGLISILVDGYVPTTNSGESVESAANDDENQTQQKDEAASEEPRQRILDLLFSLLYDTDVGQLDDYRAGYFEKILSVLFRKRPQALSDYINDGGGKGNVTLMKAMFKHLYSHSIMQLVQRLLLPQPPQLQQQTNPEVNADEAEEDEGNLILGAPGMEAIAAAAAAQGVIVAEADDETKTLQCNWCETEEALNLLLQPLINPSGYGENGGATNSFSDEEQERRLNLSQNSSEVLITIIQNSPLNSQTMLILTVDPIMDKLINGASTLRDGEDFSPHESTLTATMNVLESLVLQLGGYGSVGTISLLPTDEDGEEKDGEDPEQPPPPQFADLKFLLIHIPRLLRSLSELLQHPTCDSWRSPMQFSKSSEPHLLLGMSRLRIVRLLESLVLLGESTVDSLLCQSDCLEICLNLFWKFQWCSMLHQSVANLLVHVFEGANARSEMQEYFLVKCNLLGRLMDSFGDVSHEGFNLRECAPMPDFTEQELVIAMKDAKMGLDGAGVNAPQPNDMGSPEGTERVLTDGIIPVSDDDVDAVLEQQVEQQEAADMAAAAAAMVDLAESEPAAAQEDTAVSVGQVSTEAVQYESRDTSTVGAMIDGAPAQSFRLGYMGHVIIICQALVHACSTENEDDLEPTAPDSVIGEDDDRRSLLAEHRQEEAPTMNGEGNYPSEEGVGVHIPQPADNQAGDAGRDDGESERGADSNAEGVPPPNPLMLSKLIDSHPLRSRWQDFVKSTLSTETAIQSTPLGGFNNNPLPGGDPLHAHRPLGDGDDFDDGSGQPNMPPRGMLGGGEVIDMDDNDLDIAANGSGNTYDSGEKMKKGYFFDDPLGGKKSGLGLALGSLGQYNVDGSDDEGDGKGSDHSSDDDGDGDGSPSQPRRTTSSGDVPVMNLFAGNLGGDGEGQPSQSESPFGDNAWSDFANFDDAFAGAAAAGNNADDGFTADFGSFDTDNAPPANEPFPSTSNNVDDIFGGGPTTHAILLDDPAEPDMNAKDVPDQVVATDTRPGKPEDSEERPELSGS
ncbi:Protein phosphatase 6, regulatory subunit [Seminavis robusta]|uniref:Protein phosphatase 6, regulatory subunit n=1 Tax=Seminavis robusta TaxID=568900 RepID=A0A9N8DZ05_9STRA|nr:Protein phosphatase 6, regulatory subunit [Seminavis robusta]|eukprot:Sro486_g152600.1 Protein phosphatase 6, regulatory subunit (1186) ;mRNA; f:24357-28007